MPKLNPHRTLVALCVLAVSLLSTACATDSPSSTFDPSPLATTFTPGAATANDYLIGPLDKLSVQVFQFDDLSVDELQVDAGGQIALPQVGTLRAAGKSIQQLTGEIAAALKACCLVNPQVAVLIKESVSQQVTVTGAVVESGVFPIKGRMSLLQAVALAKGVDVKSANLKQVGIFRVVDGSRQYAIFDLSAIRNGALPDPEVIGGDVVVVDQSGSKTLLSNFVTATPLLGLFRPYGY